MESTTTLVEAFAWRWVHCVVVLFSGLLLAHVVFVKWLDDWLGVRNWFLALGLSSVAGLVFPAITFWLGDLRIVQRVAALVTMLVLWGLLALTHDRGTFGKTEAGVFVPCALVVHLLLVVLEFELFVER